MISLKRRIIIQVSVLIFAAVFIIVGIFREEVLDVINNARIICLSCIGIK